MLREFRRRYAESPEAATSWYYDLSRASDYIRSYRIVKDLKWKSATDYGELDITVNLSKPEKDPKAIAAAGKARPPAIPSACCAGRRRATPGGSTTPAAPTTV